MQKHIHDPSGIEGTAGSSTGFALFDMQTQLYKTKQLRNRTGRLCLNNARVSGYEIHAGISEGNALEYPAILTDNGNSDGAVSTDQQIMGTYFHGLFAEKSACDSLLKWSGLEQVESPDYFSLKEKEIDRLASCIEQNLNVDRILQIPG